MRYMPLHRLDANVALFACSLRRRIASMQSATATPAWRNVTNLRCGLPIWLLAFRRNAFMGPMQRAPIAGTRSRETRIKSPTCGHYNASPGETPTKVPSSPFHDIGANRQQCGLAQAQPVEDEVAAG
jgi:hypothetical protein